uniref:hypothetical protein n=1 Tax=Amycolatopsis sp. CA-151526 TaxID=3239921 RepID=UPI003F49723D
MITPRLPRGGHVFEVLSVLGCGHQERAVLAEEEIGQEDPDIVLVWCGRCAAMQVLVHTCPGQYRHVESPLDGDDYR